MTKVNDIQQCTRNTVNNCKKPDKVLNIPFIDFWKEYDYKRGCKEKVERVWNRLKDVERVDIMAYLPGYKASTPDKQFRKHPMTFLNNKSWNDEIIEPVKLSRYGELLKHPKWQRRRLEIMQRDNFTCQVCLDTETELQVHHKKYINGLQPWEYEDSYLITLCNNCHKKVSI